jgi:hypothetical protein
MAEIIQDGTGNQYTAKVDSNFRFYTDSVTRSHAEDESLQGDSYNINTGIINLTTAAKSAVLYVENTGTEAIIIENLFYLIGNSASGSGDVLITVIRNPTTGTIVDNATACEMAGVNRNFGSSKTLSANMYKGAQGYTITDGDKVIESIFNQAPTRASLSAGTIVLNKGNSIGIEITPATGNTSLDVEFALAVHTETI